MAKPIHALDLDLDHFRSRVLQDALTEATAAYWLRRAAAFDFVGNTRCDKVAEACRAKASVILSGKPADLTDEVRDVLRDVA